MKQEKWFRFEDIRYAAPLDEWESPCGEGRVDLWFHEFCVIKSTPKGVFLDNGRFVLKSAKKRYACPTVEEAKESFIRRKERQLSILKSQQKKVEESLKAMESRYGYIKEASNERHD